MQETKPIDVLCMGVVRGTPRTYGDTKNDDIWRRTIAEGNWEGLETLVGLRIPLHLDFSFRVNPNSPSYRGRRWDSGPDLDTMVIGALGGLLHCRNPLRPTLRLIQEGGLCRVVTATKTVIDNDEKSGFTLHLRAGDVVPFLWTINRRGLFVYCCSAGFEKGLPTCRPTGGRISESKIFPRSKRNADRNQLGICGRNDAEPLKRCLAGSCH